MLECAVVAIGLLEHSLLILDHTLDSELAAAHKVHLTRDKLPVIGVDDAGSTLLDLLGRVRSSQFNLSSTPIPHNSYSSVWW